LTLLWFGDENGIRPPDNLAPEIPETSSLEDLWETQPNLD